MTGPLPQPPVGPPGPWAFPTPARRRLDNGVEVVCYDLPGQYVISTHLVLDVPLAAEPRDLEGVATLCARALDEGTRRHPGEKFAELLENEGAGFGVEVSLSGLQAVLDVPVTHLEPAFALFAEAVTEPLLDDADVARHAQLRLGQIEQAYANSSEAATIAFRETIFDPDTRASRMSGGGPATVAAVDGAAARRFHTEHVGPAGATLVLAGDFGDQDPFALAQTFFGEWANDAQIRVPHEPNRAAARRRIVIDRPGAVQADVRWGAFGIDRLDPRWSPATVACYAVGGAFLSRLNAVLREEKGYTYGVRMALSPMRDHGSFAVAGSFRTDVVADALRLAPGLVDVAATPVTQAEVDDAVNFYAGISPLRYATADGVADQAGVLALMGLPEDYVTTDLATLRAVTPDAATAAYSSLVDVADLSLVVVGDADLIADPLRELGFDDLQVVSAR